MTQVAQSIHQNGFKSKISSFKKSFIIKFTFHPIEKWTKSLIVKDGFSSPQDLKAGSVPFYSPSKFIFSYV